MDSLRGVVRALVLLAVFILAASQAQAAIFDPGADWKTIETKHFRMHFPGRIEEVAGRAAEILEEIFPKVTQKWGFKPWSYTEVVLADNTDDSNGLSSVLPYNWMLIYVAPPDPDSSLAHYDDWLRMLLIHEFTHIVQIDAYGGSWYPLRILFGKLVSPSGMDPMWMREGVAQYDETIFTNGGRGRGTYSEMVVRTSILEDAFPPIDVADGQGWRWPGYKGAYIYGIKFIQWLVDTYGEDKFLEFDRGVRKSIMLGMINHQSKRVYGKTLYELWREWKNALTGRYAVESAKLEVDGLTKPQESFPVGRDEQFQAPAVSGNGEKVIYTATSPHEKARIIMKDIATGEEDVLKRGQEASQFSWSPDGKKIAYSAMGTYKRYNRYHDLWVYDFDIEKERHRAKKITKGLRARDPDFFPDGKSLVFVKADAGTDILKKIDIETKKILDITSAKERGVQYANPRVSPDGKYIAVSVWRPGDGWRIYRLNADGTNPVRLTRGKGLVIEARPAWSKDGGQVVFSSDESGISNLYLVPKDGGEARRITNVLSGVFQPAVANDGSILAQYYTAKGFEIARFEAPIITGERKKSVALRRGSTPFETGEGFPPSEVVSQGVLPPEQSRKYVAFGHSLFLPRFIMPNMAYVGDAFFFSALTGGADVLRWQNWLASVNYRTDAGYWGYTLQYWYNRFRPVFGVLASDYAVDFGNITFVNVDDAGNITSQNTVRFFEKRRAVAGYTAFNIKRHGFNIAYYFEDHLPKTPITADEKAALNLGHFAGLRFGYVYGDAERYPASISQENGRTIRLTTSVTNKRLGSGDRNEQVIFSGDWREYVRLIKHHVLALRAGGGITWGDRLVQGTFGLGGALGEGAFGGAGSFNYYPFRGLPVSAFSRTRVMLFSSEYRFPLFSLQRGLGTTPFFLKDISGALLADYGNAWNAHEAGSDSITTFFDNFLLSVGAELRGDFVLGHGLPLHGRLGYAVVVLNRDRLGGLTDPILGDSVKNGMIVLTLGTSF